MTNFYVHDENSLSNLLISELYHHNKFDDFLRKIEWDIEIPKNIKSMEIHHQLNLSEFGKPDVILSITDEENKKYIFIIEAKLDTYNNSCDKANVEKFDIKSTSGSSTSSCINNQLTLRYRAFNSLGSLDVGNYLTENKEEILNSKFYNNDKYRRCKKEATINVLKEMNKNLHGFYLVVLTSDDMNPFNGDYVHPFFENKNISKLKGIGFINWKYCNELLKNNVNSIFVPAYNNLFKNNIKLISTSIDEIENEDEKEKALGRGVMMIYSKVLNPTTFLHFSWDGESAALRNYSKHINPDIDVERGRTTSEINSLIEESCVVTERKNRLDLKFWEEKTTELNKKHGITKNE